MCANGALVLARNTDEADVLQEFADTRLRQEGYRAELLSGREVAALYDGRLAHHCARCAAWMICRSIRARRCPPSPAIWRNRWA